MGGGGGILSPVTNVLFGKPQQPATPDYRGAAQETAAGNLEAARAAAAANRVNQETPYGNLTYTQSGTDSYGNPTWTAKTSLSDVGQQLLDTQNQTSLGLGSAINAQLGQVQNVMGQGFNPNTTPITTNIGEAGLQKLTGDVALNQIGRGPQLKTQTDYAGGMQGWDRANQILQARLQPQMMQDRDAQAAKLANQGIVQGTKAYENAMRVFNQGQNDLLTNSQLAGQNIGQNLFNQGLQGAQFGNTSLQQMYGNDLSQQQANNAALQQMYSNSQAQQIANNAIAQQAFGNKLTNANLNNAAQQTQYNQALTNYNIPLNTLSALRSGAQVQNPSFVNVPQQATTAGADYLGAMGLSQQNDIANANAANAQSNAMMSGLFSLGGAGIMKSDIRTKENIKAIGWLPNGLPVYEFEYKPEFKNEAGHGRFIGVMAHEVEQVLPQAVVTTSDGYKAVDYRML